MGADDKARAKGEEVKGKIKETAGEVTDDEELEHEGRMDQAKGKLKEVGEKVKDVIGDAADAVKKAVDRD